MNKSIEKYISELLFLHDCVIIPEFGGFVCNARPAQLNNLTGTLTPPSKQILFNANLKTNDGLLITHISKQEELSQNLAKKEVLTYAAKITKKLTNSKVLRLTDIGLFTLGKENNIIFLQDSSKNYSLDSFGMEKIYKGKIIREIASKKIIKSNFKKVKQYHITPKIFLKAAAVIIPLVAISYLSISQQENINNVYTQMASFNLFKTEASKTITKKEIIEITTPIANKKEIILSSDKEEKPLIHPVSYHIIGGAFLERKNAERLLSKLNKWNYNATIINENNLIRVSYETFNNKEDAITCLKKIKQDNPKAWLLTR